MVEIGEKPIEAEQTPLRELLKKDAREEVHISNCVFGNQDFIAPDSVENFPTAAVIHIHECSFHTLQLVNLKGRKLSIHFKKCNFQYIDCFACDLEELTFTDSTAKRVVIMDPTFRKLKIESSEIGLFNTWGRFQVGSLFVTSCRRSQFFLRKIIDIDNLLIAGSLEDVGIICHADLEIKDYSRIDRITLQAYAGSAFKCNFSRFKAKRIKIESEEGTTSVTFDNFSVDDVVFERFKNAGRLEISNFFPNSTPTSLMINESDLGLTYLRNVDFNFIKACVMSSDLGNIRYAAVRWCNIPAKNLIDMTLEDKREIFNQLKNVSQKQTNKPDALKFLANEMTQFHELQRLHKGSAGEQVVLWFSHFTNRFGQSWTRPCGMILAIVFISYFLIKILLGFTVFNLSYTAVALSEMLECVNPVRKFNDSFGLGMDAPYPVSLSWAKIIDIIFLRLGVSLLIYQMVKAFRKYAE